MKTACTQLKERLLEIGFVGVEDFVNTYIEIEKKQIIESRIAGVAKALSMDPGQINKGASEDYYNETFNS